jgi:hypothetical protein
MTATVSMPTKSLPHVAVPALILTLACVFLFGFAAFVGEALPPDLRTGLTIANLVLALAFMVVSRVKRLAPLKLPLLLVLSATGGLVISALAIPPMYAAVGLMVATVLALLLLLIVRRWFDFEKLQGVLGVLSLAFSLLGAGLVYVQAYPLLTVGWALAALVCLWALLHVALKKLLTQMKPAQYIDGAAGVFLVSLGIVTNVVIVLLALQV